MAARAWGGPALARRARPAGAMGGHRLRGVGAFRSSVRWITIRSVNVLQQSATCEGTRGVIYVAVGDPTYRRMAHQSIASLRRCGFGAPVAVVCDEAGARDFDR